MRKEIRAAIRKVLSKRYDLYPASWEDELVEAVLTVIKEELKKEKSK